MLITWSDDGYFGLRQRFYFHSKDQNRPIARGGILYLVHSDSLERIWGGQS